MPITIETICVKDIHTDARFQRPQGDARITRYAAKLNPHLLGVPELWEDELGRLFALDGQHRIEAVRRVDPEGMIAVRIHRGLSYEQAADVFRQLNNERKKLEPVDDFHAAIEANDPDALALNDMVKRAGFKVVRGRGPNRLQSVQALRRMYATSPSLITVSLLVCRRAWYDHLEEDSLPGLLIEGVHTFIRIYPEADLDRLVKVLSKKIPAWWTAEVNSATNSRMRAPRMALLIHKRYNTGTRTNRLPDKPFV